MSNKRTPTEFVQAMLASADAAGSSENMAPPGTFARAYGETVKDDLNAENVDAFLHGAAVCNLLFQEAILRVTVVGEEVAKQAKGEGSEVGEAYSLGTREGALLIAGIMAMEADRLIASLVEGPAVERAFNKIVQDF